VRPDVSELIGSLCRILEDVVAPEVAQDYPREVLHGVVSTLRAVQEGWPRVLPFLAWDNQGMAELLRRVQGSDGTTVDTTAGPTDDPTDVIAAQARNQTLRAALATLLADDDPAVRAARAPVDDDILRHLEERARRTPIRHIPEMPRVTPPAEK